MMSASTIRNEPGLNRRRLARAAKEGKKMRKMIFLGWLIVFLPAMAFAQEKIEAPVWNVGDRWIFAGDGSIEVVKADQGGYILRFSEKICNFESQECRAIFFEKATRNRIDAVEGEKRKKYVLGLSKILAFPLSAGKQWKSGYSSPVVSPWSKATLYYDYSENFKVLGWEEVQVRAGKFKTFRLEYKRVASSSSPLTDVGQEIKHHYWYSPDAKYFVKCEYDKAWMEKNKEVFNWELTSFQLKK